MPDHLRFLNVMWSLTSCDYYFRFDGGLGRSTRRYLGRDKDAPRICDTVRCGEVLLMYAQSLHPPEITGFALRSPSRVSN